MLNYPIEKVHYCAKCRRQQTPQEGEKCRICKRQTVSWDINNEKEFQARKKWNYINN